MVLISVISRGVKPAAPERHELISTDRRILWQVCNVSWSDKPKDRWTMSKIVKILKKKTARKSGDKSLNPPRSDLHTSPSLTRAKSTEHTTILQSNVKKSENPSGLPIEEKRSLTTVIVSWLRSRPQRFKGDSLYSSLICC